MVGTRRETQPPLVGAAMATGRPRSWRRPQSRRRGTASSSPPGSRRRRRPAKAHSRAGATAPPIHLPPPPPPPPPPPLTPPLDRALLLATEEEDEGPGAFPGARPSLGSVLAIFTLFLILVGFVYRRATRETRVKRAWDDWREQGGYFLKGSTMDNPLNEWNLLGGDTPGSAEWRGWWVGRPKEATSADLREGDAYETWYAWLNDQPHQGAPTEAAWRGRLYGFFRTDWWTWWLSKPTTAPPTPKPLVDSDIPPLTAAEETKRKWTDWAARPHVIAGKETPLTWTEWFYALRLSDEWAGRPYAAWYARWMGRPTEGVPSFVYAKEDNTGTWGDWWAEKPDEEPPDPETLPKLFSSLPANYLAAPPYANRGTLSPPAEQQSLRPAYESTTDATDKAKRAALVAWWTSALSDPKAVDEPAAGDTSAASLAWWREKPITPHKKEALDLMDDYRQLMEWWKDSRRIAAEPLVVPQRNAIWWDWWRAQPGWRLQAAVWRLPLVPTFRVFGVPASVVGGLLLLGLGVSLIIILTSPPDVEQAARTERERPADPQQGLPIRIWFGRPGAPVRFAAQET